VGPLFTGRAFLTPLTAVNSYCLSLSKKQMSYQ